MALRTWTSVSNGPVRRRFPLTRADATQHAHAHAHNAGYNPKEIFGHRRPTAAGSGLNDDFAAAWLAFDGFSPEASRGAHTPNLFRAREKWRKLAPEAASTSFGDETNEANPEDERVGEPEPAEEAEAIANV